MRRKGIKIKAHGIEILSQSIAKKPAGFEGNKFDFKLELTQKVLKEKKVIVAIVEIKVFEFEKSDELAQLLIGCGYELLEGFDQLILGEDGIYDVPQEFTIDLAEQSVLTARGYLFSILKGTYLNKAILPFIEFDKPDYIT